MPIGGMAKDAGQESPPLKGSPDNPGREPTKRPPQGKGSIGDQALMDAIVMVVIAWLLLVFLYGSLRGHNI